MSLDLRYVLRSLSRAPGFALAVILTHGAVKRTQTTATTDLDRAKRVRDSYLSAKAMGRITRQDWRSDG